MTTLRITPDSIDGELSDDPIYEAASRLVDVVEMEPGVYPTPHYFHRIEPGMFRGLDDGVRIRRGSGATLYLTQPQWCRDVTFERITIEAGPTAAVITDGKTKKEIPDRDARYYQRVNFIDCVIDGGFIHATGEGISSKWGMRLHQWTGSVVQRCTFKNIKWEHGLYATQLGWLDTLIDDCLFSGLGRTAVQVAHRHFENDGEQMDGELRFRNCRVDNHGLADGGGAFTVAGVRGVTWIEDCRVVCTEKGNALVQWAEFDPDNPDYPKPGSPNWGLVVHGFEVEGGPCVRPLLQIAATDRVMLSKADIQKGANPTSIWLNGRKYGMGGQAFPIKDLEMSLTGFKYEGRLSNDETTMRLVP